MSDYGMVRVGLTAAYGAEYVRARLVYDMRSPVEVQLILQGNIPNDSEVTWMFARDLLIDGLRGYVGVGDVRIWPLGDDKIALSVNGMDGETGVRGWADMSLRCAPVMRFLGRSFHLVPHGDESRFMDIGAHLEAFLEAS